MAEKSARCGAFSKKGTLDDEFAERIERDFPVRRKEKEKVDFRTWLVYTLEELGYSPKLESGTSALSAGAM